MIFKTIKKETIIFSRVTVLCGRPFSVGIEGQEFLMLSNEAEFKDFEEQYLEWLEDKESEQVGICAELSGIIHQLVELNKQH